MTTIHEIIPPWAVAFLAGILLVGCRPDDMEDPAVYDPTPYVLETGHFPAPPLAGDNLPTQAGVRLGRMLFYEKSLSRDGSMACADCHKQIDGFSDSRVLSIGVEGLPGLRQSMPTFNLAWHRNGMFWDGRSPALRHQALQPIQDPLEMNETLERVIQKLNDMPTYRDQFVRAFGDDVITEERIGLAIEQFMVTIISQNTKYDRFLKGEVTLTDEEERGRQLFFGEFDPQGIKKGAECFHCHGGFNFTNDLFMNNGLDEEADFADPGRFAVTGMASDMARFKTPSLRNIALTAPYMHDGRFPDLASVIDHYNTGVKSSPTVDFLLQYNLNPGGLKLDASDKSDLIAFLHTLTDTTLLTNPAFASPF